MFTENKNNLTDVIIQNNLKVINNNEINFMYFGLFQ